MIILSVLSSASSLCNYRSPAATLSGLSPLKTSRTFQKLLFHSIAGTLALSLLTTPLPSLSLSSTTTITKPSDANPDLCIEEKDAVVELEVEEKRSESITNEELVEEAWEVVNDSYVGNRNWSPELWKKKKEYMINGSSIKTRDRAHDVIKKMLESLGDPYTRFVPRSEFLKMARYDITGIGINLREVPGANGDVKLKVLGIILDGPAHSAGVRQGDELLSVNGVGVKGKSAFDVSTMLQGPNETFVTVEVRHGNCGQIQRIKVQRQPVARTPVYYRLEKAESGNASFGYINIKEFNALATKDLIIALKRLQQSGAFYFVLDLRDNLGGLVQAGIEISKLFLNKGETVGIHKSKKVSLQNLSHSFQVPLLLQYIIVSRKVSVHVHLEAFRGWMNLKVLVNNRTASASEIVATALHDNCRAVLVGERTYGKGLIQSVFELHDGSGVVVTIGKYVTPDHKDINDVGVEPDFSRLPDLNEIRDSLSRCKIQRTG